MKILAVLFSVCLFVALQLNWVASIRDETYVLLSAKKVFTRVAMGAVAGALLPFLLAKPVRLAQNYLARRAQLSPQLAEAARRRSNLTPLIFSVAFLGAFGVPLNNSVWIFVLIAFVLLNMLIYIRRAAPSVRNNLFASQEWLSLLFFGSGFSAIIYQVVWQRAMFASMGSHIQGITAVVSVFMLGLGLGSLLGGFLSKRFEAYIPHLFFAIEVGIGLFGIFSLAIIEHVTTALSPQDNWGIIQTAFLLLLAPTLMMGATLPLLVSYVNKTYKNVGVSVSNLYFINTLGASAACFATVLVLFSLGGKSFAVVFAAIANFVIGFLVFDFIRRQKTPSTSR